MELTYEQALYRAAALCTKSERCETDIRTKLKSWNINADDADKLILYLKKERFLDEERFCRFFVKDKSTFNKWGKVKIAYHLRAKGISPDTIENALSEINESETIETLVQLLRSKDKSLKYKDEYEHRTKLLRFAASRGFDMKQISEAIKQMRSSFED